MYNLNNTCKKMLILLVFFISQCAKTDPVTGEKIIIEPDPKKKAEAFFPSLDSFGEIEKNC